MDNPMPKQLCVTQYQSQVKDTIHTLMQRQKQNYMGDSLNIRMHANI